MRHDATQTGALFVEHARDGQQLIGVRGLHAGAVAVAIDFDECGDGIASGLGTRRDRARGLDAVNHHRQVDAPLAQGQNAVEFRRRYADCIQQIGDARGRELLGLLQRGDRGRALRGRHETTRDLDGLGGFQMGTQPDAVAGHQGVEPADVSRHARFVQQQAGGFQGIQRARGVFQGHGNLLRNERRALLARQDQHEVWRARPAPCLTQA